jgi:hypothetical protein
MGFTDDVRTALLNRIGKGKAFANNKRMADELQVDPSQLNRFLKQERGLNADSLGRILDGLGAEISFPDEPSDASMDVCFVAPQKVSSPKDVGDPLPEDYLAVPLAASPVAAGPGLIPEDAIESWVLVWRHHESVRHRSNLVAVQVGKGEMSMVPTLHPGDIVLVDRDDRDPAPPGKIMLVCEPGAEGGAMVKRVNTKRLEDEVELIFYSDNSRDFPPMTYRLERDYEGDITRAIGGNVVWAWSDMSRK